MCYMCVCVRKEERRETQVRLDRMENRVLKEKVYIHKENMRYKNVALQGVTTDTI